MPKRNYPHPQTGHRWPDVRCSQCTVACLVVGHKGNGSPIFHSVFGKTQKELLEKLYQQKIIHKDVELM